MSCCPWQCACEPRWAGDMCEECAEGWFGPECGQQCPGGACKACSGHGECDDGTTGTGVCACYSNSTFGYWNGDACSTCSDTWGGAACTTKCESCGVGGRCDQYTAKCACSPGWSVVSSPPCSECVPGRAKSSDGLQCVSPCPGELDSGAECGGHGGCGVDATCECDTGWWGGGCGSECPCYGRGGC
eukprot:Hpha_TRINITY_DN22680_c0_g1::TRINITY_DN22680_c0_g1_i1::g.192704::m.192704